MRSSIIFLLVSTILLVNLACMSIPEITTITPSVRGDNASSSTTNAWNSLVAAYSRVKQAESHGTSHDAIVRLSGELGVALSYYQNSTVYASENNASLADHYAALSSSQSNNVTIEANALDTTARSQTVQRQELTYFAAFIIALASSTTVIEKDRLEGLLHRRKITRQ